MVLVDTSVWSNHLRRHDAPLAAHLEAGQVLTHPFVIGELACGLFPGRAAALALLNALPGAPLLAQAELIGFIDRHAHAGRGVGFVDIHLLASALVSHAALWTRDRRLSDAAAALGIETPAGR